MPVDDRTRLNLLRRLEAVLGPEEANTLMAHLPPVAWNEVATKDDLGTLGTTLRSEVHAMEIALRHDMQTMEKSLRADMQTMEKSLRADMQTMEKSLRADMQAMEKSLRADMHVGFAELRTEIAEGTTRQLRWLVTFAAAWSSLLIAAVRLVP
jgi:hypothetical protein